MFADITKCPLSYYLGGGGGWEERMFPVEKHWVGGIKGGDVIRTQGSPGKAGTMKQRGLSSESWRHEEEASGREGEEEICWLLPFPLNLLQAGVGLLIYTAEQGKGQEWLRMLARYQHRVPLKLCSK